MFTHFHVLVYLYRAMSSALEDIAGSEACEESQDSESIILVKTESPSATPDSTPQRHRKASTGKRKERVKRQKTYLDPSLMLPPINQKGSMVCVGLVNLPLWQQFSSLGTEMLVNKRGRCVHACDTWHYTPITHSCACCFWKDIVITAQYSVITPVDKRFTLLQICIVE